MSSKNVVWVMTLFILVLAGCGKKNWQPSWDEIGQTTGRNQGEQLYLKAREKIDTAADRQSILASMTLLQKALAAEPAHREALAYLGNLHILLGTAYTDNREEKRAHFQQAMKYCELSMYGNPQFREAVEKGSKPWQAVDTLQIQDVQAMLFWVIALQYEFKEGMTLAQKVINIGWLKHGITFLDRIALIDPDFGNGAVEFSYSICYFALPSLLGGDKELGELYMKKAIARGKDYLLPKWGKGKYYYQVTDDYESGLHDLQWVARQKLDDFKDLYPWRVYFITDAQLQINSL